MLGLLGYPELYMFSFPLGLPSNFQWTRFDGRSHGTELSTAAPPAAPGPHAPPPTAAVVQPAAVWKVLWLFNHSLNDIVGHMYLPWVG